MTDFDAVIKKKQAWKKKLRNQQAQALRSVRESLRTEVDKDPFDWDDFISTLIMATSLILVALFIMAIFSPKAHADNKIIMKGYSNAQICEAIRHAEGVNSKYPYGIKSVSCSTKNECKDVCIRTIRNYRKDFEKLKNSGTEDFIQYSSRRYVAGDTRANQKNWVKNVKYFLIRGV